jgi:hypothetical protein
MIAFCKQLKITVQDCSLPLHSVEYCLILIKSLYIFVQNSFKMDGGYY